MPNHCSNHLTVVGPEADISRFISAATKKQEPKQVDDGDDMCARCLLPDGACTCYSEKVELFNLYPCPQELKDTTSGYLGKDADGNPSPEQIALEAKQKANIEKYGHKDWYDWCIANWGTKWGDYDTYISDGPVYIKSHGEAKSQVSFNYTTAWGPGIQGLVHISERFPTLWFVNSYEESGMGFYGCVTIHGGDILIDEEAQFPEMEDGYATSEEEDDLFWEKTMEQVRKSMDAMVDRQSARIPV